MTLDIGGPPWLTATLGTLMLAAAIYAAARIGVAWRTKRVTDFEVDGHHVLMGVSMAGMLIPALRIVTNGPSTAIWLCVWLAVTVWFGASVLRRAVRHGAGKRFRGHHLPHLVMSAAMVYMFSVILSGTAKAGTPAGMSGMSTAAATLPPWPTLDAIFLVFMAAYAGLVVDRFPLIAPGIAPERGIRHEGGTAISSVQGIFLARRAAGGENVLMAIVMGFMLGTMLA
jgi:hypothetical protein